MPSVLRFLASPRELFLTLFAALPGSCHARRRRKLTTLASIAFCCWLPASAEGSDPVGIYALVDRVVFEPNAEAPTRVQVHGAFCTRSTVGRRQYNPPVEGYLYLKLKSDKVEQCRNEWRDLETVTGKGTVVGLGSRWHDLPRVRHGVAATDADTHPLHFGVRKLSEESEYEPNRWLRHLPRPSRVEVQPGGVALVVKPCAASAEVLYLFELESPRGEILGSPAISPGEDGTIRWLCRWQCVPGEKYRWRVRILPREESRQKSTFAVARSTFEMPKKD